MGLKGDRGDPQIQIFQHFPHLPQGGLGKFLRKHLVPRVDFHATGAQTRRCKQGFLERLAKARQLDTHISLLHCTYLEKKHRPPRAAKSSRMTAWLTLLILSVPSPAPIASPGDSLVGAMSRYTETVFATDFERAADMNYDGWPDNWTRRRGKGFPPYVEIRIVENVSDAPGPGQALRIQLDGGGGIAYSPVIEISSRFTYVFEGKIRTRGLTPQCGVLLSRVLRPGTDTRRDVHVRKTHLQLALADSSYRTTDSPAVRSSPGGDWSPSGTHAAVGPHRLGHVRRPATRPPAQHVTRDGTGVQRLYAIRPSRRSPAPYRESRKTNPRFCWNCWTSEVRRWRVTS